MENIESQTSLIASSLAESTRLIESTRLTDTSGNPKESYHWRHMAAVRREWMQEFWRPYANALEPTLMEIISAEMRVRKELYP